MSTSDDYARAYGMAARQQASGAYGYSDITGRKAARQMVRDIGEIVAQVEGVNVAASILYQAADAISASLVMPYVVMPPIVEPVPVADPVPVETPRRAALAVAWDATRSSGDAVFRSIGIAATIAGVLWALLG
ncbi:MAG: hypothetical protein Q7S99_03225 [Parvibaculum sp.]|nr:hypothetical protein [Parvibaculum sp.]